MHQQPLFAGLQCLPGQQDLFGTDGTPDAENQVSAADLVNHEDELAPVSGARCRECGHAARRDPGHTTWYVEYYTAYCAECWAER
jgi:hypothetical protein